MSKEDPKKWLDEKISAINPPYEPKKITNIGPPSSEPSQGDMKYDPVTNGTKIYVGGSWIPIANSISKEDSEKISSGVLRGMSISAEPSMDTTVVPSTTTRPMMTGSTGWTTTGTTTSSPMLVFPEAEPVRQKRPDKKVVEFPKKVTKKVVIGFVEDDDTIVWGAKLKIIDFHIDFETIDGEGRITLVTDIEDVGA